MVQPVQFSILPLIPLHIWQMAQIHIGPYLLYVAAQTSYMPDLGLMLKYVLPHGSVFDLLVETTTGVCFAHVIKCILIMSKMDLLASVLTQPATKEVPYTFHCCLKIVWSQLPVDIALLVKSIQTLVTHYQPNKVYFNRTNLPVKYALIPTDNAKRHRVQTHYNGILGHQTGQHWYIVMHDTTEDIIDYVTIKGTNGPIDVAIDRRIMQLIGTAEHTMNFTTSTTSRKRKHEGTVASF